MIYDNYYKCIISEQEAVHTTEIHGKRMVGGKIEEAIEYVYWSATEEKNGVRVSWDVKKHNKDLYILAIKDQLLYFKNHLKFVEVNEDTNYRKDNSSMFATILYESKSFIISSNSRFTQPHILINNVNYGLVDFTELGINKMYGNVAIKAGASDVDITASREAVKWTEKTRNYILDTIEEASYEAGEVLKDVLEQYTNPIERFIQANSSALNFAQSKNSEVIKQLKAFCGEVKISIPVSTKGYIDEKLRLQAGVPDTVEISKVMQYVDTRTTIHTIGVYQANIRAAKATNLSSILMNKKNLFLLSDKGVKNLNSTTAHFWSKGNLDFQYVVFRDSDPDMITREEAIKAKILYKTVLKNQYLKEISRGIFRKLLQEYMTNVESLDEQKIKEYADSLKITDDQAIIVKDDSVSNYTVKHKTERERKEDLIKEMKKAKLVLPFKVLHITPFKWNMGSLSDSLAPYQEGSKFQMTSANQADLVDITINVVYATTKERALLESVAFMLKLKDLLSFSFTDEGKYMCIMISEENVKLFKQIPNSMSVQTLFKEKHEIIDEHLHIKSGAPVLDFMTNIRLQQAMYHYPAFFTLPRTGNSVIGLLRAELNIHADESDQQMLDTIYSRLNTMYLSFQAISSDEVLEKAAKVFSAHLNSNTTMLSELFATLENMTILQDTPSSEHLESEDLKAMVAPFKGYKVEFYDKSFVDQAIKFMRKYELLLLYCIEKVAIKDSSNSNHATTSILHSRIDNQISEFFNNLKQ